MLEQSDDAVVQEVLARQAGRAASQAAGPTPPAQAAQPSQPAQPQAPGQIDAMAPTMAVGTAAGTVEAQPQQSAAAGSGYGQVPQGYGSVQPTAPGAAPQQGAPQGYGRTTAQPPQSPLPQDPSQVAQPVALPPSAQPYSAPSMQSAAQPVDQQTAMPPGVRSAAPAGYAHGQSGAPSGYGPGQAQAYDPGQAYGPSQSAAPAYGAEMYAQQAQPRKRRGLKVLAIILPVALLLTGGGVAAWYFLSRSNVYAASRDISVSDAWTKGASKTWSADVEADAEPYVAGDYFLTFNKSTSTLTGYTPLGSGMKEAWKADIDDESLTSSYALLPEFQLWGKKTLVYKSTLIDLESGKTSSAPWEEDKYALITDDIAIGCTSSGKCTAWDSQKKQKWSHEIAGVEEMPESPYLDTGAVLVKDNHRYTGLFNAVIDIDTGDTTILGGKRVNNDSSVTFLNDGWVVNQREKDASEDDSGSSEPSKWRTTIYDFKGKKKTSYLMDADKKKLPAIADNTLISAEEFVTFYKDNDLNKAPFTFSSEGSGCVSKITSKDGNSTSVVNPEESSDHNSEDNPCPSNTAASQGGKIAELATWRHGDASSILLLMEVSTGRTIEFTGIDWQNGDSLIAVKPNLIIGYDKDDGKVSGFKPAS
ncbi:hypothetical protein [Actinomyces viscosus]|nr:hypothetical protein [Actinomyces viscosus]